MMSFVPESQMPIRVSSDGTILPDGDNYEKAFDQGYISGFEMNFCISNLVEGTQNSVEQEIEDENEFSVEDERELKELNLISDDYYDKEVPGLSDIQIWKNYISPNNSSILNLYGITTPGELSHRISFLYEKKGKGCVRD